MVCIFSSCVAAKKHNEDKIIINPNPTFGAIYISSKYVEIKDGKDSVVYKGSGGCINLSYLPEGFYYIGSYTIIKH